MSALSREDFDRIDRALAAVLEHRDSFSDFHNDFAFRNADRLGNHGRDTFFSAKQWEVVEEIEQILEDAGL